MDTKVEETKQNKKVKLPYKSSVKALIFYSNHKQPEVVTVKDISEDFFTHKNKAYYIDFEDVMSFKSNNFLFGANYYLFYHYNSEQPLRIDEKLNNLSQKRLPNSIINTALKTKAIEKAHDIKNKEIDNIYLYGGIGIAVIIAMFFMFGG